MYRETGTAVRVPGQLSRMYLLQVVATQGMTSEATSMIPTQDSTARRLAMLTHARRDQ